MRAKSLQLRPPLNNLRLRRRTGLFDLLHEGQMRLLGLAHARVNFATGWIDRNIDAADDRRGSHFLGADGGIKAIRIGCLELRRRQQLAADLINEISCTLFAIKSFYDLRIFASSNAD